MTNKFTESMPGASQAELAEIEAVLNQSATESRGNTEAFERIANTRLAKYGIRFDSQDELLNKVGMPARADISEIVIRTPYGSDLLKKRFGQIMSMVSHELVHQHQISRAMLTGSAAKMYSNAYNQVMPGGKFDSATYANNPEEVTAYARSSVDSMRSRGATKSQALDRIKRTPPDGRRSARMHRRFMKHSAAYANDLPESAYRLVSYVLEDSVTDTGEDDIKARILQGIADDKAKLRQLWPYCPDCDVPLDIDDDLGRDTETMGGMAIEYLKCQKCGNGYSKVVDADNLCLEYPLDSDTLD